MHNASSVAGSKSFVRSLNLLLKSARLYGIDHSRCANQFRAVWSDLQTLLQVSEQGCVLGVAGKQLLIDGAPVDISQAERSFVDLLGSTGLASVHFTPQTTEEDLLRLVRGFASLGPKAEAAGDLLQQALAGGNGSIRLNAVRYVTEDAALGESAVARLAAKAIGAGPADLHSALENPQLLLQMIAAAQGRQPAQNAPAVSAPTENDVLQLLRALAGIARSGQAPAGSPDAQLPPDVAQLPAGSQDLFQNALASLAAMGPAAKLEGPMLVQLAEHLAIRFALEQFDRGDVRVNSVRELLERSSREIASLRKVLTGHEDALSKAGVAVESHADILDRQFWAAVPDSGKRTALLSAEAWCIPPRNVRQFLEELLKKKDPGAAAAILLNYASCVGNADADARKKSARGLAELAAVCAQLEPRVLDSAIRCVGEQLTWEEDADTQEALAAAYAKLAQEALGARNLPSIQTALNWLEHAAGEKPDLDRLLRPRLGVEDHLPGFIAQAIREKETEPGLAGLLRRSPAPAAELLASRFHRCARREECRRVLDLFGDTGEAGARHLQQMLQSGAPGVAATTVGLLSSTGTEKLERLLVPRIGEWNRAQHDVVVQQIASAAAPDRGRLLARIFPLLDRMVLSAALDEISLSGDPATATLLLRMASGEMPQASDPFLRAKAIEGLGRLREPRAETLLREIASARQMWRWIHPEELRVVALQALDRIDPGWARHFVQQSGLKPAELALAPLDAAGETPWARHRRYARVSLQHSLSLTAITAKGESPVETNVLSLGGGATSAAADLLPGTPGSVTIRSGWRNFTADVLFREAPRNQAAFEIVEIGLEERSRLRRLLASAGTG